MKTAKKLLSLLLVVIFTLSGFAISANAATTYTSGDYEYTVSGSNATITKYTGTASSVSIPSTLGGYTVNKIGNSSFKGNSTLTSVSIPSTVTTITEYTNNSTGYGAFENCPRLQTVTIAAGSKDATIGSYTFHNCPALTSITIPGNYITINRGAFEACTQLKSMILKPSSSTQIIGSYAFASCSSLTSISLPNTLNKIYDSAFKNCDSLTTVTIPEGVTLIDNNAFRECDSLTSVSIPSTVTTITEYTNNSTGYGAFENCPKLQTVTIAAGSKDATIGSYTFHNCPALTSITIPGNYITINRGAFEACTQLKSMILKPSSYTYSNQIIGSYAFAGCSSLTSISLPNTLNKIYDSAFKNCDSLTTVTIPEGVTLIDNNAFRECDSLTSVSIPSTVTTITEYTNNSTGYGAFENCPKLQTVTIAAGSKDAKIGSYTFHNCSALTSITIPGNYTTINRGAFEACTQLKSMILKPSSYTYSNQIIGSYAFAGCSSLTSISLPNTLNKIYDSAFKNCDSLTTVTIPEGVTLIDNNAFRECDSLTSVSIPSTVTTITEYTNSSTGYGAFENCPRLQTVTIAAGSKDAKIGSHTFNGDKSLTTVHIPSNYVNIYKGAFSGCSNVTICNTTSDCYAKTYADANGISFKICSGGHGTPTTTNCTVTFNGNGGTVSPTSKTVTNGTSITLPTPYSRTGYTCLGWSTSSSATSATYSCGASYAVNSNVTLYAVWKQNEVVKYKVTFSMNDGSVNSSSQDVTAGNSITIGSASRPGYEFLGWSTNKNASYGTYFYGDKYTPTGNTTFYAIWKAISTTYTLSYNANGGSGAPSSQTGSASCTISSTVPTCFPKTFLGWAKSSSATSATYKPGDTISLSSNTTLYAVWKTASSLSTGSSTSVTVGFAEQVWYYKFIPSTSGTYIFESTGSSDSKAYLYSSSGSELASNDDDGTNSNFKLEYNMTSGTIYYLAFRCYGSKTGSYSVNTTTLAKYTVKFDAKGGSVSPLSDTEYEGHPVKLPTPTKSGYICLGWSTSKSATSASYSCGETYYPSSSITLYAVWKELVPDDSIEINYKDTYILGYYGFTPVEYYSDNPAVATVSSDGTIYGAARGRTYVHAVDAYGNEKVTEVNVTYTVVQWIIVIVLFGWIWY